MERIDLQTVSPALYAEHIHRYRWISALSVGSVLDIACGEGYGSKVLAKNELVTAYQGMDIDKEVVAAAKKKFGSSSNINFSVGDLASIPSPDAGFDTVVSLETLEHLSEPERGVQEAIRVLKPGGRFLGSVPTKAMDQTCEEVYGENPHHHTRFDEEALRELLISHFKYVTIFMAFWGLGTSFYPLFNRGQNWSEGAEVVSDDSKLGSFMFVASNKPLNLEAQPSRSFMPGLSLVEYDRDRVVPFQKAHEAGQQHIEAKDLLIEQQDRLIAEHQQAIKDQATMIEKRDRAIEAQASLVIERDKAVADQTKLIKERDELVEKQDKMILQRDKTIADQTQMVEGKDTILGEMEVWQKEAEQRFKSDALLIESRDAAIAAQAKLVDEKTRALESVESMVSDRDEVIVSQAQRLEDRWQVMEKLNDDIKHLRDND